MTIYTSIRINTLRPSTFVWLQRVLACLDNKDVDGYLSYCSERVTFSFNNASPDDSTQSMQGKDIAREGLRRYWANFQSIEHEELNLFGSGTIVVDSTSVEGSGDGSTMATDDTNDKGEKEEEEQDQFIIHEALNRYITKDGRTKVTLRAVACLDRDSQGRIEGVRIYSDQSPLFKSS